MKLTANNQASRNRIKDNVLYRSEISKAVFATTPDFEGSKYAFNIFRKEWNVTVDNNYEKFYIENYFPVIAGSTNIQYENPRKWESCIPNEYKNCIGVVETGILNFIYDGGHRLLLIGKEGWGKTTLLRFVSNLIPKLKNVEKLCIPIYFSFNKRINDLSININDLTELQRKERYDNIFYDIPVQTFIKNCRSIL